MKFLKRPAVHIALIALTGLAAYSNTFDVPFQFDDNDYIVENPVIKDFGYFTEPSKAGEFRFDSNVPGTRETRSVAYLTFLANYKAHGLKVRGYHEVNLLIHLLNSFLVYCLVILAFKTPLLGKSSLKRRPEYIALFAGLLFVSHPIQTQAVTYISQRFTSLAAMFCLGAIVFYAEWRLRVERKRGRAEAQQAATGKNYRSADLLFYCSALFSALLAMKTKENAFTLPLAVALYEQMFFKAPLKKKLLYLFPFVLTMLIIPAALNAPDRPLAETIGWATKTQDLIPRRAYLFTQFGVIVTYLRLLIFPLNQNLDYDRPAFYSIYEPGVFLPAFFLLALLFITAWLCFRFRNKEPLVALISFGAFFFFVMLSVESSVVALHDLIFEHRVYLPSAGAFAALSAAAFLPANKIKSAKLVAALSIMAVLIISVLGRATYCRNRVWGSEISLWEDVVRKSPKKARGYANLATAYCSKGMPHKAIEHYKTALVLNYEDADAHHNIGIAYHAAGSTGSAIEHYKSALRLRPEFAEAHYDLAVSYEQAGSFDNAVRHYQKAVELRPDYFEAYNNLGIMYMDSGLLDKAVEHFNAALKLRPDYEALRDNLGLALYRKGLKEGKDLKGE